jgi:mRNA interferase MazF
MLSVIPLSTNTSKVYPGETLVTVDEKQGKAMADQIMAADKVRLKTQIGKLSKPNMLGVEQAILVHLGMPK